MSRAAPIGLIVIGLAAPLLSTAFGLYDRVEHWGKLMHALDAFCAASSFGLLFFAWRDLTKTDFTDELGVLLTMLAGVLFGVLWEIVEFVRDWVAYSDLQKSNTDTMTDFLCNDVACVLGALLAARIYTRVATVPERRQLGSVAQRLVEGPSRLLERHGMTLTIVVSAVIVAAVASLWFAGRPIPGVSIP